MPNRNSIKLSSRDPIPVIGQEELDENIRPRPSTRGQIKLGGAPQELQIEQYKQNTGPLRLDPVMEYEHPEDLTKYKRWLGATPDLRAIEELYGTLGFAAAERQSGWYLTGAAINQAVVGHIIGGTLSGFGTLGNIISGKEFDKLAGNHNEEWGQENWLSRVGDSIMEWAMQDATPIHQTKRASEGWAPGDATWWASMSPSMFSTVSLLLPTTAVARTVGYMGRLLQIQKALQATNAGRTALRTTDILGRSLISRTLYTNTESIDTWKTNFERAQGELGMNYHEAVEYASNAASANYRWGYANIWQDMFSWGMILKAPNLANMGNRLALRDLALRSSPQSALRKAAGVGGAATPGVGSRAAGKFTSAVGQSPSQLVKHGFLQGLEEYNIQWQKKEGQRAADIKAGLIEEGYFGGLGDRIYEHTFDRHTWDSAFWGFMGGMVFGGVSGATERALSKGTIAREAKALRSSIENAENTMSAFKAMAVATVNGDVGQVNSIISDQWFQQLHKSAADGTLEINIELANDISTASKAEAEKILGQELTTEQYKDFQDKASDMVAGAELYKRLFNEQMSAVGDSVADRTIADKKIVNEYKYTMAERLANRYNEQFTDALSKIKDSDKVSSRARMIEDARRRKMGLERYLSNLKRDIETIDLDSDYDKAEARNIYNAYMSDLQDRINKLDDSIKSLNEELNASERSAEEKSLDDSFGISNNTVKEIQAKDLNKLESIDKLAYNLARESVATKYWKKEYDSFRNDPAKQKKYADDIIKKRKASIDSMEQQDRDALMQEMTKQFVTDIKYDDKGTKTSDRTVGKDLLLNIEDSKGELSTRRAELVSTEVGKDETGEFVSVKFYNEAGTAVYPAKLYKDGSIGKGVATDVVRWGWDGVSLNSEQSRQVEVTQRLFQKKLTEVRDSVTTVQENTNNRVAQVKNLLTQIDSTFNAIDGLETKYNSLDTTNLKERGLGLTIDKNIRDQIEAIVDSKIDAENKLYLGQKELTRLRNIIEAEVLPALEASANSIDQLIEAIPQEAMDVTPETFNNLIGVMEASREAITAQVADVVNYIHEIDKKIASIEAARIASQSGTTKYTKQKIDRILDQYGVKDVESYNALPETDKKKIRRVLGREANVISTIRNIEAMDRDLKKLREHRDKYISENAEIVNLHNNFIQSGKIINSLKYFWTLTFNKLATPKPPKPMKSIKNKLPVDEREINTKEGGFVTEPMKPFDGSANAFMFTTVREQTDKKADEALGKRDNLMTQIKEADPEISNNAESQLLFQRVLDNIAEASDEYSNVQFRVINKSTLEAEYLESGAISQDHLKWLKNDPVIVVPIRKGEPITQDSVIRKGEKVMAYVTLGAEIKDAKVTKSGTNYFVESGSKKLADATTRFHQIKKAGDYTDAQALAKLEGEVAASIKEFNDLRQHVLDGNSLEQKWTKINPGIITQGDKNITFQEATGISPNDTDLIIATKNSHSFGNTTVSTSPGAAYINYKGRVIPTQRGNLQKADVERIIDILKYIGTLDGGNIEALNQAIHAIKDITYFMFESAGRKAADAGKLNKYSFLLVESDKNTPKSILIGTDTVIEFSDLSKESELTKLREFLETKYYQVDDTHLKNNKLTLRKIKDGQLTKDVTVNYKEWLLKDKILVNLPKASEDNVGGLINPIVQNRSVLLNIKITPAVEHIVPKIPQTTTTEFKDLKNQEEIFELARDVDEAYFDTTPGSMLGGRFEKADKVTNISFRDNAVSFVLHVGNTKYTYPDVPLKNDFTPAALNKYRPTKLIKTSEGGIPVKFKIQGPTGVKNLPIYSKVTPEIANRYLDEIKGKKLNNDDKLALLELLVEEAVPTKKEQAPLPATPPTQEVPGSPIGEVFGITESTDTGKGLEQYKEDTKAPESKESTSKIKGKRKVVPPKDESAQLLHKAPRGRKGLINLQQEGQDVQQVFPDLIYTELIGREVGKNVLNTLGDVIWSKDGLPTIIRASKNAPVGTLWHEAGHEWIRRHNTPEERIEILESTVKDAGDAVYTIDGEETTFQALKNKLSTDEFYFKVEEFLMEEFRDFATSGGVYKFGTSQKKMNWFQRLWADIQKLVKTLFPKVNINSGIDVVQHFENIMRNKWTEDTVVNKIEGTASKVGEFDSETSTILIKHFNKHFFDTLFDQDIFNQIDFSNLPEYLKDIYTLTQDYLIDYRETLSKESIDRIAINALLANWNTIEREHAKFLRQFRIQIEVPQDIVQENKMTKDNTQYMQANLVNVKDTIPSEIKLLVAGLSGDFRILMNQTIDTTVDYGRTLNLLINRLSGLNSMDQMGARLVEMSKKHPYLGVLMERVGINSDGSIRTDLSRREAYLNNKFFTFFHKFNNDFITQIYGEDGGIYNVSLSDSTKKSAMMDMWKTNIKDSTNTPFTLKKAGRFELDPGKSLRIGNTTTNTSKLFSLGDKTTDILRQPSQYNMNPVDFVQEVLGMFGINLTNEFLDTPSNYKLAKAALEYIQEELTRNHKEGTTIYADTIFDRGVMKVNKELTELSKALASQDENIKDNQIFTEKGTEYAIQEKTGLNKIFDSLATNEIPETLRPFTIDKDGNYSGNIATAYSQWIKSAETGNAPIIKTLKNAGKERGDKIDIDKLKPGDLLSFEINNILEGKISFPRSEGRSMEYVADLGKNLIQKISRENQIEQYRNYLEGEVFMALAYINTPDARRFATESGGQVHRLSFFRDIVPAISKKLDNAWKNSNDTLANLTPDQWRETAQALIAQRSSYVNDSLDSYISEATNRMGRRMIDLGLVYEYNTNDRNLYGILGLSIHNVLPIVDRFIDVSESEVSFIDGSQLTALAELISYYYTTGGIEFSKLVTGDLATFIKEDISSYHKRTTTFTSTISGSNNTISAITNMNRNHPRLDGTEHGFNRRFVTVSDVNVGSELYPLLKEIFKDPVDAKDYESGANEADGQTWAPLDGYKSAALRTSIWNDAYERSWQYEAQMGFKMLRDMEAQSGVPVEEALYTPERFKKVFGEHIPKTDPNGNPTSIDAILKSSQSFFNGEIIDIKDVAANPLPVLKLQGTGQIITSGLEMFNKRNISKTAVAPLLPSVIKGTSLERLFQKATNMGIDMIPMESAEKGERLGDVNGQVPSLYKPTENGWEINDLDVLVNNGDILVTEVSWNDIGNQLAIDPSGKTKVTTSSQKRSLHFVDMLENGKLRDEFKSLEPLFKDYNDFQNELVNRSLDRFLDRMGITSEASGLTLENLEKFYNLVKEELESRLIPDNLVTGVETILATAKQFTPLFDTLPNKRQLINLVQGLFRSNAIQIKRTGDMLTQLTVTGFEQYQRKEGVANEILKTYIPLDKNNNPTLKWADAVGIAPAEALVSLPPQLIPFVEKNFSGRDFSEKLEKFNNAYMSKSLKNQEVFDKIFTFTANRIPGQHLNSIEVLRVKRFLSPSVGSIVVMPSEIVVKSGSDFDIDKLTSYFNNIRYDKDGNPVYMDYLDKNNSTVQERAAAIFRDSERLAAIMDVTVHPEYSKKVEEIRDRLKQAYELNEAIEMYNPEIIELRAQQNNSEELLNTKESKMSPLVQRRDAAKEVVDDLKQKLKSLTKEKKDTKALAKKLSSAQDSLSNINREIQILSSEIREVKQTIAFTIINQRDILHEIYNKEGNSSLAVFESLKEAEAATIKEISKVIESLPIIDQNTSKALENRLTNITKKVMLHKGNYSALMKPNGSRVFKEQANKFAERSEGLSNIAELLELSYNMDIAQNQWMSLALVGILAVNTTSHAKMQAFPVEFNDGIFGNLFLDQGTDGISHLGYLTDSDGLIISETNASGISAAVDAGKETYPAIFRLNYTTETASTYQLLNRVGTGKSNPIGFGFLTEFFTQPIISEYINDRRIMESVFMQNSAMYDSKKETVGRLLEMDGDTLSKTKFLYEYVSDLFSANNNIDIEKAKSELQNAVNEFLRAGRLGRGDLQSNPQRVLEAFLYYQELAKALNMVQEVIRPDTNLPKDSDALRIKKIKAQRLRDLGIFTGQSLDRIMEDSFIKSFQRTHDSAYNSLKNFDLIRKSRILEDIVWYHIMTPYLNPSLAIPDDKLISIAQKIQNAFTTTVLHRTNLRGLLLTEHYDRLFKGSNSFARRAMKIKSKLPNNKFLSDLIPVVDEFIARSNINTEIDYVKTFSGKLAVEDSNSTTESIRELFNNPDTEVKNFAMDLVIMSILQSGTQISPFSYYELLPAEVYQKITSQLMEKYLDTNMAGLNESYFTPDIVDRIMTNLRNDTNIIPIATLPKNPKAFAIMMKSFKKVSNGKYTEGDILVHSGSRSAKFPYVKAYFTRLTKAQQDEYKKAGKSIPKEVYVFKMILDSQGNPDLNEYNQIRYTMIPNYGEPNKLFEISNKESIIERNRHGVHTTDNVFEQPTTPVTPQLPESTSEDGSTGTQDTSDDFIVTEAYKLPAETTDGLLKALESGVPVTLDATHVPEITITREFYETEWGEEKMSYDMESPELPEVDVVHYPAGEYFYLEDAFGNSKMVSKKEVVSLIRAELKYRKEQDLDIKAVTYQDRRTDMDDSPFSPADDTFVPTPTKPVLLSDVKPTAKFNKDFNTLAELMNLPINSKSKIYFEGRLFNSLELVNFTKELVSLSEGKINMNELSEGIGVFIMNILPDSHPAKRMLYRTIEKTSLYGDNVRTYGERLTDEQIKAMSVGQALEVYFAGMESLPDIGMRWRGIKKSLTDMFKVPGGIYANNVFSSVIDGMNRILSTEQNTGAKYIVENYFPGFQDTNIKTLLGKVSETSHPLAELAHKLNQLVVDNNTARLKDNILYTDADGNKRDAAGQYNHASDDILISRISPHRGGVEVTIVHEALHAMTIKALNNNSKLARDMNVLYEYAKSHPEISQGAYPMKNIREFVVGLFENGAFIKQLHNIPATGKVKMYKNLFEQVIDTILEALGIKRTEVPNLHSQAFALATHLIMDEANIRQELNRRYEDFQASLEGITSPPIETMAEFRAENKKQVQRTQAEKLDYWNSLQGNEYKDFKILHRNYRNSLESIADFFNISHDDIVKRKERGEDAFFLRVNKPDENASFAEALKAELPMLRDESDLVTRGVIKLIESGKREIIC